MRFPLGVAAILAIRYKLKRVMGVAMRPFGKDC